MGPQQQIQLVEDMSDDWDPHAWRDSFKDAIMKLVDHKVASGETSGATALEAAPDPKRSEARILDLTELLQRSLRKGGGGAKAADATGAVDAYRVMDADIS